MREKGAAAAGSAVNPTGLLFPCFAATCILGMRAASWKGECARGAGVTGYSSVVMLLPARDLALLFLLFVWMDPMEMKPSSGARVAEP